tara:strand:+ start:86 stop:469 length:384 start_codon:yes stop_codon:yes gene_type:complete
VATYFLLLSRRNSEIVYSLTCEERDCSRRLPDIATSLNILFIETTPRLKSYGAPEREAYGTCGCSLQNKLELGNGTAIIAAPSTTTGQAEKDEPRAKESTHNRERKNVSGIAKTDFLNGSAGKDLAL